MSGRGTETDLVTGAFSYSGSRIAELLIEAGREVRFLTHHPDRQDPLRARVHVSPYRFLDSLASPLPYYRGKALVEQALVAGAVPYSIVRPTWIFGGRHEVLANNIAWILRHMPIFVV